MKSKHKKKEKKGGEGGYCFLTQKESRGAFRQPESQLDTLKIPEPEEGESHEEERQ